MRYKILFSKQSLKDLIDLDKAMKLQIIKKIKQLEENSELGKPLRGVFKNYRSLHIGKYRVLYSTRKKEVIIVKVEHRKKAYAG